MQKQTTQSTFTQTRTLRIHGTMPRRSMHRYVAVAVVGAVLLIGAEALTRNAAELGPGESS